MMVCVHRLSERHQPVAADAMMAMAQGPRQLLEVLRQAVFQPIQKHIVIAGAVHFGERQPAHCWPSQSTSSRRSLSFMPRTSS